MQRGHQKQGDFTKNHPPTTQSAWRQGAWILLFFLITYSICLGCRALGVPDEARYSEIPREMWILHDYITPHLDFIKYFEKPPLFYWLQTAALQLFGLSETAARLVTMILSVLGIGVTYLCTRFLFDTKTALLSALILGSSLLYFAMGHLITTDMTLSFFMTLCLFSFFCALHTKPSLRKRSLVYMAFAASALAVLTKGLIGLAFPCMIFGLWIVIYNEWRVLKNLYLPSALVIFLVIALPWHIAVQHENPEFFRFYFITQQVARYATMVAQRYQPMWFFIPILLAGLFPWIVFFFQSMLHALKQCITQFKTEKKVGFLLIWALSIFIFYSCSDSKLIPYITPIFPPMAVLIARYLQSDKKRGIAYGYIALIILSIMACIGGFVALSLSHHILQAPAKAREYMLIYSIVAIIASVLAAYLYRYRSRFASILSLSMLSVLGFIILNVMAGFINTQSVKPLALTINTQYHTGDAIVAYDHYYQDLPYYTEHKVILVGSKNELAFGFEHQANAKEWIIDDAQFSSLWNSSRTVFVVIKTTDLTQFVKQHPHAYRILNATPKDTLIVNHKDTAA